MESHIIMKIMKTETTGYNKNEWYLIALDILANIKATTYYFQCV